jgi:hypothetical protein
MVAGKSVTSRKGMIYGDVEIKPEFFHEGEKTIKKLIERGLVEEIEEKSKSKRPKLDEKK